MPITEVEEESEVAIQLNKPWKVIVLNDPVNLMNYVVLVFRKVFGYDKNKATKHMMEVHELGKSVLWIGEREQAESYMYQLQRWKFTGCRAIFIICFFWYGRQYKNNNK